MPDHQLVAIAITVLAILGGTLVNNSRIGDINHRLGDLKELLRAEIRTQSAETALGFVKIESRFNSIDRKLDEILRITALEPK